MGPQQYPLTVGHEIIGVVEEAGSEVTLHAVGDRVGVGIAPEIELIPADAINEAYERVLASDVRYRFVIDAATLA